MNLTELPEDLPHPLDDGACDHLADMVLPALPLPATGSGTRDLSGIPGIVVVYCYPMTGRPGVTLPAGWDMIPGARGCTPESCGFRDHHRELQALGATVFGLSAQSTEVQSEAVTRLHLPFELLSDAALQFTRALRLPTFDVDGMILIKRLTLIAHAGLIRRVFYPVFPPDQHAGEVVASLRHHGT